MIRSSKAKEAHFSRHKAALVILGAVVLLNAFLVVRGFTESPEQKRNSCPEFRASHSVFQDFEAWLEQYRFASPSEKAALSVDGIRIGRERRAAMLDLIINEPETALAQAIPEGHRAVLPQSIAGLLEQHLEGAGDLFVSMVCGGPDHLGCRLERLLRLQGRRYSAHMSGHHTYMPTRTGIFIRGIALDGYAALIPEPTSPGARPITKLGPSKSRTTGNKSVLVIRADFPDASGEPVSLATAETELKRSAHFLHQNSQAKLSITPVFLPEVMRLPHPKTWYQEAPETRDDDLLDHAVQAARAYDRQQGADGEYDADHHDFYIVAFTKLFSGWRGKAYVGRTGLWLNGSFLSETIEHELGHNLGLYHANAWIPREGETSIGAGDHEEYGDLYDNMGKYTNGHFNAFFKQYLNWLESAGWKSVSRTGTHRVFAHDHVDASGLRALRFAAGRSKYYWLGLRHNLRGGELQLRRGRMSGSWMHSDGSQLLDMTPETRRAPETAQPSDQSLILGDTFHDPIRRLSVTPVARGGQGHKIWVDIRVVFGVATGNRPPSLEILDAPQMAPVGESFQLMAKGSDPDGDKLFYMWEFEDGSPAAYGKTAEHTFFLGSGSTFDVTCTALDGRGGRVSTTVSIQVTGSDDPLNSWVRQELAGGNTVSGVGFGDGCFVVVGDRGSLWTRNRGADWRQQDSATGNRLFSVAFGRGRYVAVGSLGTIITSTDTEQWGTVDSPISANFSTITFGEGKFIVAGSGGSILTSPDGLEWTWRDSGSKEWLKGACHGGDRFVVVGAKGTILTSDDGVGWKKRASGTTEGLTATAYGDGRFIAVGSNGTLLGSANGIRWSRFDSGTSSWLLSAAYGREQFVVVGSDGSMIGSLDGRAWFPRSPEITSTLNGVTYGDRRFVVAGTGGLVLLSGLLPPEPKPPTLIVHFLDADVIHLSIQGQEGQLYRMESSADLLNWKVLKVLPGAATPVGFDDIISPGEARFYRALTP